MSEPYGFILHAKTHPAQAEAFKSLFLGYVEASRSEVGCTEYHMLQDEDDPSLFVFFEVWESKAALEVHSGLPHMQAFFEARMTYLERDFQIQRVRMLSPASMKRL